MFGSILEDYDVTRQDNIKIVKVNADENGETASFFDPSKNNIVQGRETRRKKSAICIKKLFRDGFKSFFNDRLRKMVNSNGKPTSHC